MLKLKFYSNLAVCLVATAMIFSFAHADQLQLETPVADLIESDVAATVHEQDNKLEIVVGKSLYRLSPSAENLQLFSSLSQNEQKSFLNKRVQFISQLAKAFEMMKYGFGIGSLVKDKIRFMVQPLKDRWALRDFENLAPEVQQDVLAAKERTLLEREQTKELILKQSMKERSEQIIQKFLSGLDQVIWGQAQLFAKTNEFGLLLNGNLTLFGGSNSGLGFGGQIGLGVSIGYNSDEKTVVIQIFRDIEKFKSTTMIVGFTAAATAKAGFYIENHHEGENLRKGVSFYPPIFPVYSTVTPSHFQVGLSAGIGFRRALMRDTLTYTNELNSNSVIRITFSRMLKSFVRIEGRVRVKDLVQVISVPVQKMLDLILSRGRSPAMCKTIFSI